MKNAVGFFGGLVAWALLVLFAFAEPAHAQTVTNVVAQTCNIAQTDCVLEMDDGAVITINPMTALHYPPTPVLMDVQTYDAADNLVSDTAYSGSITSYVLTYKTIYKELYDVQFSFTPTATLTAIRRFARSGSGRGGWAWHTAWFFETLTVY